MFLFTSPGWWSLCNLAHHSIRVVSSCGPTAPRKDILSNGGQKIWLLHSIYKKILKKKISTMVKTYCHGRGICLSIFSLYCRVHESLNLEPRKIVLICSFNVISWCLISTAPQSQQPLGRHKAPGQQPQSVKVCKRKGDFFLHFPDHKRKVHSESVTSITITANTNNP